MPNSPIADASSLYVSGLAMATVSTPTVSISPGSCRDSTDTNDIKVASSLLLDLTKSGVNGFDTGASPGMALIKVFVIGDSTGNRESASIASRTLSPLMPFGYDMFRRVGHLRTIGSGEHFRFFVAGEGRNKWFYYDRVQEVGGGSSTSYDDVDCSEQSPPLSLTVFIISWGVAAANAQLSLRTKGSLQNLNTAVIGQVAGVTILNDLTLTSDANAFIEYKVDSGVVTISVRGWLDAL